MVRFLVSTVFSSKQTPVIASLHPRVDVERVSTITNECGGLVLTDPINCLIPLADVIVAVVSETIRTAVAYRIPCIKFDIHNYDYDRHKKIYNMAFRWSTQKSTSNQLLGYLQPSQEVAE